MKISSRFHYLTYAAIGLMAILVFAFFFWNGMGEKAISDHNNKLTPSVIPVERAVADDRTTAANTRHSSESQLAMLSEQDRTLLAIARDDLDAAIRFIAERYPSNTRRHVLAWTCSELCKENLELLPSIVAKLEGAAERQFVFGLVSEFWSSKDSGRLRGVAASLENATIRNELFFQIAQKLADGGRFEEAAVLLDEMPLSEMRLRSIDGLASEYCRRNPNAAMIWISRLSVPEDRAAANSAVFRVLSRNEDATRLGLLFQDSTAALKEQIALEIGRMSAKSSIVASLPGADQRHLDLMTVGAIDGATAADIATIGSKVRAIQSPDVRVRGYQSYIERLFSTDSAAAVKWVLSTPQEELGIATGILAAKWYHTDTEGLNAWVATLDPGYVRDTALSGWAQQLAASDVNGARKVAEGIQNPQTRSAITRMLDLRR